MSLGLGLYGSLDHKLPKCKNGITAKMSDNMPIEQPAILVGAYKLWGVIVAFFAPIMAFFLLLSRIPLDVKDPQGDAIKRLFGCVCSSFVLGAVALVYLKASHPEVFVAAEGMGLLLGSTELGKVWMTGAVLLVCGLPGWALVGMVSRTLQELEGKDLSEGIKEARQAISDITAPSKD
jgi:hypothetical protein